MKYIEAFDYMTMDEKKYCVDQDKKYHAELMVEDACNAMDKIKDIMEGTISHFDYEDAMDMLYDIKRLIE